MSAAVASREAMKIVIKDGRLVSPTGGSVRLHHGTDAESGDYIVSSGVSYEQNLRSRGTGEFWVTIDEEDAQIFAGANPMEGPPCVVSFDVPTAAINLCIERNAVADHFGNSFEFFRESFAVLNESRSNVQMSTVASIEFDV